MPGDRAERSGDAGDAVGAARQRLEPVGQEDQADDLAEAQGDDGQVVAAHLQHGDAQDDAGRNANQHRKGQRLPPGQLHAQPLDLRRGQDADGVGAQGKEGHVAQVQQAGEAHHDVQAQPHQDVEADCVQHLGRVGSQQRQQQHADAQYDVGGGGNHALLFGGQSADALVDRRAGRLPEIGDHGRYGENRYRLGRADAAAGKERRVEDRDNGDRHQAHADGPAQPVRQ